MTTPKKTDKQKLRAARATIGRLRAAIYSVAVIHQSSNHAPECPWCHEYVDSETPHAARCIFTPEGVLK